MEVEIKPQQHEQFSICEGALEMLGFQLDLKRKKLLIKGAPDHCPTSKIERLLSLFCLSNEEESSLEHFSHADQVAKTMAKS
jgi:hypothetical protein